VRERGEREREENENENVETINRWSLRMGERKRDRKGRIIVSENGIER